MAEPGRKTATNACNYDRGSWFTLTEVGNSTEREKRETLPL